MGRIAIAGDFAPTKSNEDIITNEHVNIVLGEELANYFRECEFVGVNLETSLSDVHTPKVKRGQINRAGTRVASFFPRANIGMCFLANNHVIDNGNVGVESTISSLEQNSIIHIGAGRTEEESKRCFFLDSSGTRIGFYNVANYEFNKVTATEYGVNTYDPLLTFDEIQTASNLCDYLIVVYHGGLEYYRYPTPELQRICRKMVEKGADLVTCQHSHCIGTYEEYLGSTIVYGQGNFLFDDSSREEEKSAFIIELSIETKRIEFIPVVKSGSLVRMATDNESGTILQELHNRHDEVLKKGAIEHLFKVYCQTHQHEPLRALTGYNILYRGLNKVTYGRFRDYIFNKNNRMRIYNMLETPVHLEVLQEVMKLYEDM